MILDTDAIACVTNQDLDWKGIMNSPDSTSNTNPQHDSSRGTLRDKEILRLMILGENESSRGKGYPISEVLAEASALLARKGL